MSSQRFKEQLVEAIPVLRGFARALCGNRHWADDLTQETLVKAIANRDKFELGTNLHAWLITILRNRYYTEIRKNRREIPDSDGAHAAKLAESPRQTSHLEMREFLYALQNLPPDQREALILIGATGLSYEDAAGVLGVRIGTVKSRVSRARTQLAELVSGSETLTRDQEMLEKSARELGAALSGQHSRH